MPQDILGNIHYSPKRCFEHCYAAPLEAHRLFTPATRKICNEHGLFLRGSGHRLPTFCDEQKLKRSHLSSLRVRAIPFDMSKVPEIFRDHSIEMK
jgi:hypothetical protein